MPGIFWMVPIAGLITVIFAALLARNVLRRDPGTPKMKEIGDMIFEGAWAFLKREYSTIAILSVVVAVVIGVIVGLLPGEEALMKAGYNGFSIGWHTSVAFIVG